MFIKLKIPIIISLLTVSLLAGCQNAASHRAVECEGHDDTSAFVVGICTNGEFEGYDTETGQYVYGDCEFGGDLDAYNSETNEHISGECEGE